MRRTGIAAIGDVDWGTHFCQFYATSQDLVEMLVPYFREGLAGNEYCMWVTSAPLEVDAARAALRASVPDLDDFIARGQIDFLSHEQWYLRAGCFSADEVFAGWVERLAAARQRGFEGLRLTGNTFWLEAKDWQDFTRYEATVNRVIGQHRMLALCTYSLTKCSASEVLDVVATHQFALVKRAGRWECIEGTAHREMEAALRESEEKYRRIVETAQEGIVIGSREGKLLFANQKMADMLGYTRDELVGRNGLELLEEGQQADVFQARDELERGRVVSREYKFRRKDGQALWTLCNSCPLEDSGGQYIANLAMHTDITGRREAEQALCEANERLVTAQQAAHAGVWDWDVVGGGLVWSTELFRLFGLDEATVRATFDVWRSVLHPEDRQDAQARIEHAIATRAPLTSEYRVVLPTGEVRWIHALGKAVYDTHGQALRMSGICLDVTDRKRVEHTLRVSEERYRALVELAPDGIVVHQHGRFVFANAAALRLYGADTSEQFLGRSVVDHIHPDDRENVARRMQQATGGQVAPRRETRLLRLDGRAVPVESGGAPIEFEGKPGIQVIIRDVTERKQAEQALVEAHARATWLARFPDENPQAVLRVSAEGRVLYCNPAAQHLSGWSCQAGDCPPDALTPLVSRALAEARHLTEDVSLGARTYSVSVTPFPAERYANVYGTDVTERKLARAALQEAHDALEQKVRERTQELSEVNQTLRMISDCNQVLVRAASEEELVREICHIIHERGGYCMAWVGYAEQDAAKTVRPIAAVGWEDGNLPLAQDTWADADCGPTGRCIRTCTRCFCRDFLTDPDLTPWRAQALQRGYRSAIALPLVAGGQAFGALTIYADRVDAFDEKRAVLLSELADDMAFGIVALRARVERDHARQLAEDTARQLRALATALGQAEHRERLRLARILHDHIQQLLVAAQFNLATVRGRNGDRQAAERVTGILNEAIIAARTLTAELSPPALQEKGLVAGLKWLGREMHEKHGLRVELRADAGAEPDAESVRFFLYEAVRELLFNVVKHAGSNRARVAVSRLGTDTIQVTVEDSGVGFDVWRLESGELASSGFGLFSIRERLSYLGGRLTVESAQGRGARFTLVAPALAAPGADEGRAERAAGSTAVPAALPSAGAAAGVGRRIRVLLADDHPVMREGLVRLLREQPDIEVVGEAGDGEVAVRLARQLQPDVLVVDVSMPRVDGLEAIRQLRAEQPALRIIALSMHEDVETEWAMREAGAVEYLVKSGRPERLVAAIRASRGPAAEPIPDTGRAPRAPRRRVPRRAG
jgi:PAS domain S-box-containing protein